MRRGWRRPARSTIVSKKLPGPPNKVFVVKGTAFKPVYRTEGQ